MNPKQAKDRLSPRVGELIRQRDGLLPVWIRSPKAGLEHFTGLSRSKLYELAGKGKIKSISIREPGAIKGTRLFELASILSFLDQIADQSTETTNHNERT